jgi:amphi-Trp domain-containing protein
MKKQKRTDDRKLEKKCTQREFVRLLRRLADKIETARAFNFSIGGRRVKVPAIAKFEVEHKREGDEEEIELEVEWAVKK